MEVILVQLLMGTIYLRQCNASGALPFSRFTPKSAPLYFSSLSSRLRVRCSYGGGTDDYSDDEPRTAASWAYGVLGLKQHCSSSELKAAFRSKVKQFHPDVNRNGKQSDVMVRHVIQAYEILSNYSKSETIERDPFDQPECEAFDVFVNEALCIGTACAYPCVGTAPHAFRFCSETGTARAISQDHGEDYRIQRAVSQCPRNCIHFVTPSQRIILEELLNGILNVPYDTSAEADLLFSLILKANNENSRSHRPKTD